MKPFFIGIAGGSGSGKTALANALKNKLGKKSSVFHIDNYQKFGEKLPLIYGMKNWDHPKSVNWNKLVKDLISLKEGKTIVIEARNQKKLTKDEKPKIISFAPTKIIIVEGYLLFYKNMVRKLLDLLVFLETGEKTRIERRTKFKNPTYIRKVLLPMHRKYIEPTKRYADLVFNTEKYSVRECCQRILSSLKR